MVDWSLRGKHLSSIMSGGEAQLNQGFAMMEPMLLIAAIFLGSVYLYCHICFSKYENYQSWRNLIRWKRLVGMYFGVPTDFLGDLAAYTFFLKLPWRCVLATADPANVKYTLSKEATNFVRGQTDVFDVLGEGFFVLEGDEWSCRRRVLGLGINHKDFPGFSITSIQDKMEKDLIPFLDHADASTDSGTKQAAIFDLQELIHRLIFDITCSIGFGFDPRTLSLQWPDASASTAMDVVTEVLAWRCMVPKAVWKLQRMLGIGKERKLKKAREVLDNFSAAQIPHIRKQANQGQLQRCYFAAAYCNGLNLSDKLIKDEALSFFLAGKTTTSAALTWFFWVLSKNPLVETKIRQEMKAVLQDAVKSRSHLFSSKDTMNKLVYLHAALLETLRLHPPVPSIARSALEPDVLPTGHPVDPKTLIVLNISVMGKLRAIWGEDSSEFKPNRWITEKGEIKHKPCHKFLVFNSGPRTCLGKDLAFTEMKIIAATILHNYNVHILEGQDPRPNQALVVRMKHGLRATVSQIHCPEELPVAK